MDLSVQLGIALALATAVVSSIGFLLKQRGAVEAPAIEWRRPVRSSLALFSSRWYVIGIVVAMGSWGLHVAALALAPITLVQTVIAGGLVFLTVIAERVFHLPVSRRDWIGVAMAALGLAVLAATLDSGGGSAHSEYGTGGLLRYGLVLVALAGAFAMADRRGPPGLGLAASAGLLWGASDVSIKALSSHLGELGPLVLVHPLAGAILVLSLLGLLVSAGSLQTGPAVAVIAATSVAANVSTIASGPLVFGEPMPSDPLGVVARLLAFALVVVAAALIPGVREPQARPG